MGVIVNSSSVCARLCAANRGCVQFAFLSADECGESGLSVKGSCMLFSGGCQRQVSACWDLYAMQTAMPPSGAALQYSNMGGDMCAQRRQWKTFPWRVLLAPLRNA